MAYTHSKYEVMVAQSQNCATTGYKATWQPGYMPHTVRAAALIISVVAATTTSTVVTLYRNTVNTTTTTARVLIDTITIPKGKAKGDTYYVDGLNTEVKPGQEVQFVVTTAATTTGVNHMKLYVEPRWDRPANNTKQIKSV